jgi:amphi-Trp domain-containing protein
METSMEIEKDLSQKDAVIFLRHIADALEKNEAITVGGQSITIPKAAEISLEYEEDGDDTELEIEFNWTKAKHAAVGKFELFKSKSSGWYFRLRAPNSQTILTSQRYKTKQGAEKGVVAIKKNALEENIEYRTSQSDQPYFVIKAANGEVIGTSQMYKRKAGCEKGARSVVSNATDAAIEVC